jgi:hypothetical protein
MWQCRTQKKGFLDHFHHYGYVNLHDLIALLTETGLNTVKSGTLGIGDLQFVRAGAPSCASSLSPRTRDRSYE